MAHEDNVIDFSIEFLERIKMKWITFLRGLNLNISVFAISGKLL